jgi:hypothetical protein
VPVLRRSHGHHRDLPARLLAALPAGGIPNRDQDRHIMIKLGTWQNAKAALLLRRLPTGNNRARLDSRLAVRSSRRAAGSAYYDRPTRFITPSIASQTSVQRSSATDRQRRNAHSV